MPCMAAHRPDSNDPFQADVGQLTGCILDAMEPQKTQQEQLMSIKLRRLLSRQFNNHCRMDSTDFELTARLD